MYRLLELAGDVRDTTRVDRYTVVYVVTGYRFCNIRAYGRLEVWTDARTELVSRLLLEILAKVGRVEHIVFKFNGDEIV